MVDSLLQKAPEQRVQSAGHLEQILKQCIAHWEQPTKQSLPHEVLRTKVKTRLPWLIASVIFVAITLLWQTSTLRQLATQTIDPPAATPIPSPQKPAEDSNNNPTESVQNQLPLVETEPTVSSVNPQADEPFLVFDTEVFGNEKKIADFWELRLDECLVIALQNTPFLMTSNGATKTDKPAVELASRDSDAFARSLTHYQLAMTHSQRCDAADHEVQARLEKFSSGCSPVNVVLQSQQRRAQAQIDYY